MEMMSLVISFIEMTSIFLIYNVLINDDIKKYLINKIFLSIITSLIYYIFTNIYDADALIILIGILFLNSMIISKKEKKDTIVTYIEFIVSSIIMLGLELIISLIVYITMGNDNLNPEIYLLILTIIMAVVIYLLSTSKFIKKIEFSKFFSKYKSINIIILNLFVFFLLIKVLMSNKMMNTKIIIPITILGLILIGVNCYFYVFLYKTLNEKKKNEIKKSFNPLINDLMGKLKANEHEYKNHLNTIWSIVHISQPEEVKEKVKAYIGTLVEENEEFTKLLDVENTIVKAVLYNKGQRAEKLGVKYSYNVSSSLKDISLDNSELTVILSNLLNNAIEATCSTEKKEVEINISEDEKYYEIDVKNYTNNLKAKDLTQIFKMGYTTKGEGRGYGLYNVKNIVDKYKGKIQIGLDESLISIKIIFFKKY